MILIYIYVPYLLLIVKPQSRFAQWTQSWVCLPWVLHDWVMKDGDLNCTKWWKKTSLIDCLKVRNHHYQESSPERIHLQIDDSHFQMSVAPMKLNHMIFNSSFPCSLPTLLTSLPSNLAPRWHLPSLYTAQLEYKASSYLDSCVSLLSWSLRVQRIVREATSCNTAICSWPHHPPTYKLQLTPVEHPRLNPGMYPTAPSPGQAQSRSSTKIPAVQGAWWQLGQRNTWQHFCCQEAASLLKEPLSPLTVGRKT